MACAGAAQAAACGGRRASGSRGHGHARTAAARTQRSSHPPLPQPPCCSSRAAAPAPRARAARLPAFWSLSPGPSAQHADDAADAAAAAAAAAFDADAPPPGALGAALRLAAGLVAGVPVSVGVDAMLDGEGARVQALTNAETAEGVRLYVAFPAQVLAGRPAPVVLLIHQARAACGGHNVTRRAERGRHARPRPGGREGRRARAR
jgi:hypothetical protein